MKRFILTNLLAALTLPILACAWCDNHNYYLFHVYDSTPFKDRMLKISNNNWATYLGEPTDDYYYFNADKVIDFANSKGDQLMVSYVKNLETYLDLAREIYWEGWSYPTKEQLGARYSKITAIRDYAKSKLGTRLRSQHALLFMRCEMLLGHHQNNVTFWENTASKYIETIYKELMKNIYAGALVKTGRQQEGCRIFGEQGDAESMMTLYYEKRSYDAIRAEYDRDPQSKVLPFLVQDFVNNTQEAVDAHSEFGGLGGKLFIRDITEQEANSMCLFAESVVREGKTDQPALWKSAEAWIRYLYGSKKQAARSINMAVNLEGSEAVKDCARALQVFITAEGADDETMTEGIRWLKEKDKESKDGYFMRVYDRMVHQVLVRKYERQRRPETALAILQGNDPSAYNYMTDTMQVDRLINFYRYAKAPATTSIDRLMREYNTESCDDDFFNHLIGTKYMRLCQWDKAIEWLEKVSPERYDKGALAYYASHRKWTVEPWIKRQWLKESEIYANSGFYHMAENPKITFAREMIRMEQQQNLLRGEGLDQCLYDLAVRYAQADYTGDCWYLMHDTKSGDGSWQEKGPHEVDLKARCRLLLEQAAQSKNKKIRERALFALCYTYLNPETKWHEFTWEIEGGGWQNNTTSAHWAHWAALADFEAKNGVEAFVSRCDEYRQFIKAYRK